MKSIVFELKFPHPAPDRWKKTDIKFPLPTLKAYAIEYSEFTLDIKAIIGFVVSTRSEDYQRKNRH